MTNSSPTQLLVRKKITAIYADGSAKMNLGIATVVRMLKGATNVPVEVVTDAAARKFVGRAGPKRRTDRRTGLRRNLFNATGSEMTPQDWTAWLDRKDSNF